MTKFLALLIARNREFYRDKGTLLWAVVFPFLIVIGFSFAFSGQAQDQYKVAVYAPHPAAETASSEFLKLNFVKYVPVTDLEQAIEKVKRHQYDLLVAPRDVSGGAARYWVNSSSPKGYFLEKIIQHDFTRQTVEGKEARYVDWLIPGILAMNMMFSALFGVGYTIVRYRKNGVLKRFKATPINAFQFLSSQVISRMLIIQVISSSVFVGCYAMVHFQMRGSYLDLFLFLSLGAFCLISVSSLVAARIQSEELAEGILNVLSWPMIFFSGVWFSLEGTNPALQKAALIFPMTHIVNGARSIMLDGTSLSSLMPQVTVLAATAAVSLALGSLFFKWD